MYYSSMYQQVQVLALQPWLPIRRAVHKRAPSVGTPAWFLEGIQMQQAV
jgi:hypothetical protein